MKFEVQVRRTNRRKTAAIQVQQGVVQVVVPQTLSQQAIDDLIAKKSNWIRQKLVLQQSVPVSKPKQFVSGESFTYLGRNYRLKVLTGQTETWIFASNSTSKTEIRLSTDPTPT